MPVINRLTGEPPTPEEQAAIDRRSIEILSSPYSAPEKVEWAIMCASPEVSEAWMFNQFESCQQRGIRQRREQNVNSSD